MTIRNRERIDVQRVLRPRCLGDISTYDTYVQIMQRWVLNNSYPTGILFTGEIGVGKTLMANLLAESAACIGRKETESDACGQCRVCKIGMHTTGLVGSEIEPKNFREHLLTMQSGRIPIWDIWLGGQRKYPIIIDEMHDMPKQAQRILRAELDRSWPNSFLIATSAKPKKIHPALKDRMHLMHVSPPSRSQMSSWIAGSCGKVGIEIKEEGAAPIISDNTGGRFRAALKVLQLLLDSGMDLTADNARQACKMSGYEG